MIKALSIVLFVALFALLFQSARGFFAEPISEKKELLLENGPIILIPWKAVDPCPAISKITALIESSGGTTYKLNYFDDEINVGKLKIEVTDIAKKIQGKLNQSWAHSILEEGVKIRDSEIAKILGKARAAISHVQGLVLPGGQDIQPIFYGQFPHPKTVITDDLRRDVFELALLKEAELKKIPVFGICRGMQLTNVYYGGTLNQHIEGHRGLVQDYTATEAYPNSVICDVFSKSNSRLTCDSRHHQSVNLLGKNLFAVAHAKDGTIKALECFGNQTIILVQWHPETVNDKDMIERGVSSNNNDFFMRFVEAAKKSPN